jgi:hypothetical protein
MAHVLVGHPLAEHAAQDQGIADEDHGARQHHGE